MFLISSSKQALSFLAISFFRMHFLNTFFSTIRSHADTVNAHSAASGAINIYISTLYSSTRWGAATRELARDAAKTGARRTHSYCAHAKTVYLLTTFVNLPCCHIWAYVKLRSLSF
jgi:hypothetical protein